jgi:hypothetical protein
MTGRRLLVRTRTVLLHFTLYCDDLYSDQYVSSGPKPSRGELQGNRLGAKVQVIGEFSGPAASGPGTQVADWDLEGRFTRPAHFDGRIEYEAATSPAPPRARPQCLDAQSIHLDRQPPSSPTRRSRKRRSTGLVESSSARS